MTSGLDWIFSDRIIILGLVALAAFVGALILSDRGWRWRRLDPQTRLRMLAESAALADRRLDEEIDLQITVEERLTESRERRKSEKGRKHADSPANAT